MAKKVVRRGPLNIQELYSKAIKELKYSEIEISKAIYQLTLKKVLVKGTKITKDSVLENYVRNRIFKYILKNPGTHLREIRDRLNLLPLQADWHLNMLEKFGYIRKNRIKNKVVFFESKINPDLDNSIFILRNLDNLNIIKKILTEPDIALNILVGKVQLRPRKVKNIILNLLESDLINEIIEDGQVRYRANIENISLVTKIFEELRINNKQRGSNSLV